MRLTINGEKHDIDGNMTVSDLLLLLKINPERTAVEINLQIIPKKAYDTHALSEDDRIEIVHFVGGG